MPDAVPDAMPKLPDGVPKVASCKRQYHETKSYNTVYYEKELGRDAWWKATLFGLKWANDEVKEEWIWNPITGPPPQATRGDMRPAPTPEPKAKSKAKAKAKGKTKAKAKSKGKAKAKSNGKGKAAKQGKGKGTGKGN